MGRKNSNGLQALTRADKAVLTELLTECLETRVAVDSVAEGSPWSTLTAWVDAIAIPHFHKTRQTTPLENLQIYNWYKNQCTKHKVTIRRKAAKEGATMGKSCGTSPSDKLPSIRHLVINEYKSEISLSAKEVVGCASEPHIARWNQAVTDKVEALSATERAVFQTMVDEEIMRRASPPTRAEILASQDDLSSMAIEAVRHLLGWERKQYGDAIVFMTMAYRDDANQIREKKFFISNDNDFIAHSSPFNERYDTYMRGYLATVADLGLPMHDVSADASHPDGTPLTPTLQTGATVDDHEATLTSTPLVGHANPQAPCGSVPPPSPRPESFPIPEPVTHSEVTPSPEPIPIDRHALSSKYVPAPVPPQPVITSEEVPLLESVPTLGHAPTSELAPLPEPIPALGQVSTPGDVNTPDQALTQLGDPVPDSNPERHSSLTIPINHQDNGATSTPPPTSPSIAHTNSHDLPHSDGTQKPRQKRGTSSAQPVRASARSKRAPKKTGTLTDKNQAPNTKVPVSKRWVYVSEDETSSQPKKSRCH